jgi:hypothetical protein
LREQERGGEVHENNRKNGKREKKKIEKGEEANESK